MQYLKQFFVKNYGKFAEHINFKKLCPWPRPFLFLASNVVFLTPPLSCRSFIVATLSFKSHVLQQVICLLQLISISKA